MRHLVSAALLLFAATPAFAGGAEEFFLGRPPSAGVVQGGAFGSGGFDYADETRRGPVRTPHALRPRSPRHVARVGRQVEHGRQGGEPAIVARPYFRP